MENHTTGSITRLLRKCHCPQRFCLASAGLLDRKTRCPLWVKSGRSHCTKSCPLYP